MSKKVELEQEHIDFLTKYPEHGMGYQIVEVMLLDGRLLKQRIVLNSTHLLLEEGEEINTKDICSVVISDVN